MQIPLVNGREGLRGSQDPAKWFPPCIQKLEALSSKYRFPVYLKLTCPCFQRLSTCRGMYQMSMNENTQPQGPSFLEMLGHGDWLFNQPPIMQPQTTGMYNPEQMMGYAGSIQSYGEPCSYGGGSSTAQHDIGPLQHDEPPPITQPAQDYDDVDLRGVEVVRRSVRERYSPERLSLSGRRPPTGARRKGKKKETGTSRNFDDEA
ncbi:hypothetical protein OsJ_05360 [Oryza sativa Japonica Group]|uniref:Uncharacterized protein n=1 Tax=Oryza sativa subsp. japonica TaxID=39947 RepID=Q6Z2Z8_ORYSJ|nr:hypothetical protein OsJ_05360 [Oryza sativa Japonica Group]BAD13077.1 hypothetical protein [Oryza sativa Japonica Group]BAD13249.1 hypothetical protein [Oryza sativa Japonica Group]